MGGKIHGRKSWPICIKKKLWYFRKCSHTNGGKIVIIQKWLLIKSQIQSHHPPHLHPNLDQLAPVNSVQSQTNPGEHVANTHKAESRPIQKRNRFTTACNPQRTKQSQKWWVVNQATYSLRKRTARIIPAQNPRGSNGGFKVMGFIFRAGVVGVEVEDVIERVQWLHF